MCHQTVWHSSTRAFIGFFICPFRTALDSSEGETSEDLDKNDEESPISRHPSYRVDQYFQRVSESHRAEEHREEILQ